MDPIARFHRTTRHVDSEPCLNCGTSYIGNFCPNCGQEAHTGAPTALAFIYEFLTRNVLERGKLPRTIWHLLRYPGGLTVDFLEGRRQRFIRPVRLYFGLSVLYFLVLSLQSGGIVKNINPDADLNLSKQAAESVLSDTDKAEMRKALKSLESAGKPGEVARTAIQAQLDADEKASIKSGEPPNPAGASTASSASSQSGAAGSARSSESAAAAKPPGFVLSINPSKPSAKAGGRKHGAASSGVEGDEDVESVVLLKDSSFDLDKDMLDKWPDQGARGLLKKRIKRFTSLPTAERGQVLVQGMMSQAPKAMFFLVPVFALLLKMLFVFRKIPYGAHLLFAFHYHSLVFLGLLLLFLPLSGGVTALVIWSMWGYLWLALRKTYLCGWFSALMRLIMLSCLYPVAIMLALMGAFVAAVLL